MIYIKRSNNNNYDLNLIIAYDVTNNHFFVHGLINPYNNSTKGIFVCFLIPILKMKQLRCNEFK